MIRKNGIFRIILAFVFSTLSSFLFSQNALLDPTFGNQGKVITNLAGNHDGKCIAIQNDGKILLAGTSDYAIIILRYNTNGSIDSTWGINGIATENILRATPNAIKIQSDGKIVIAVTSNTSYDNDDITLLRYLPNGSLDAAFDNDGIVTTTISVDNEEVNDLVLQNDGKILVCGSFENTSGLKNLAVMRFNPNGSIDFSFNGTGKNAITLPGHTFGRAIDLSPLGKIVCAGTWSRGLPSQEDFLVVQLNMDGSIDNLFGSNGVVSTDFDNSRDGVTGIKMQNDGKIVLCGYTEKSISGDFASLRYNSNGTLDSTFGIAGKVKITISNNNDYCLGMAITPDGKIALSGWTQTESYPDFALTLLTPNGALDISFDGDGIATTDFGNNESGNAIAIQSDNKIIIAGVSYDINFDVNRKSSFALCRFNSLSIGIDENVNDESFILFPNPSSGKFTIQSNDLKEIIVRSVLGTEIKRNRYFVNCNKAEIDLSTEHKGIYFIEIISDNYRAIKKTIIE